MTEVGQSTRPVTGVSEAGASSRGRPVTGAVFFEEDAARQLQASASAPVILAAPGSTRPIRTRGWKPAMSGPVHAGADGAATLLWCKRSAADLLAEESNMKSPYHERAARAYAKSGAMGLMSRRGGKPLPSTREPFVQPRAAAQSYMRPYGCSAAPAMQMDMEYAQSNYSSSRPSTTPLRTCAAGLLRENTHAGRFAGVNSGFEGAVAFAGFPQGWIRPGVQ